ncbi:uncharacterized protein CNMa [Venturia canescens]|uniref:uncharacterized protein CNMa n=1 Tax=Venturia canescens TaxID=32260 RepID=UPI001C9C72E4|nr:uncharacterized protein LOC122408060 [Venturia canescens]XP_043270541.1 uncharacterized protein LOC122408060 [Venturia canescens]XP_043270542.1 uncharacterized protein LOC122408060 [Venturia canescens]
MCKNQEMRGRLVVRFSGLWLLAIVLSCSPFNYLVEAEPEPVPPSLIYSDSYVDDAESFLLLQRLRQIAGRKHEVLEQARELENEKMVIQGMLDEQEEARRNQRMHQSVQNDYSGEDIEMLPIPSAIVHHGPVHSGKRTSYMTLCHFKICNMGRKRQL